VNLTLSSFPLSYQNVIKPLSKAKEETATIKSCEISSGSNFFFHVVGDEAASVRVRVINESMRIFTAENGTSGSPCDLKVRIVVAALFNDGTGESWYRARVLERKPGKNQSFLC
jgi:hypothetical protein